MNTEAFRVQVREMLARHRPSAPGSPASAGVVVPLKLSHPDDLKVLGELLRRVASSPALAQACAAGLLRFELCIDAAAAAAGPAAPAAAACCEACARGEPCGCAGGDASPAPVPATVTPLLRGVITERDVKALPAGCRVAGVAPRAVLTPLARDALRQRGITVHTLKES